MSWRSSCNKLVPDRNMKRRDAALNLGEREKKEKFYELFKMCGVSSLLAYLYWSNPPYIGRLITSNLGKWSINIVRTQGAIVWVWGERKWMFKTITVTHILKHGRGKKKKREIKTFMSESLIMWGFYKAQ